MDGIAHHARSGSPINLRPTGRAVGIPIRLPWAEQAYVSTLDYAFSVRQTSYESTPRGPQRHVDRSMTLESVSSLTTEPTSGTTLASQKP